MARQKLKNMKRNLFVLTIMVFMVLGAQAQSLDKVLEKHYAATGVEKMADIKTLDIKAKMSIMGMEMPMTMKIKQPNKFRVDVEMMGQKTSAAFDGEKGWMINPALGAGPQELTGDELKQQMQQTDFEGELYNYKQKGFTAELLGKEDGAYNIKLTSADGTFKNYFIDEDSYMITKVKAKVEAMGQQIDVETKFVEYQDVAGMKIVKKLEASMPMGTMTTTMDEIKVNEKIDDSVFARPAN